MGLAAGIAAAALLVLLNLPAPLSQARWPRCAPSYGLLLWQAMGLAGGLLALELLATLALLPYGPTHVAAVRGLLAQGLRPAPWWALGSGALGLGLLARLLTVLLTSAARTLRARRTHRQIIDLVATRNPLLPRALVLDHDLPVAYCLPGLRSRVVLSRGVLQALRDDELRAVLAHEAAHLEQRHDLVVLPFVALGATFPRLRPVRTAAAQVALLIEMLADDRAARRCSRPVLARALLAVGAGVTPDGGLGAGGDASSGAGRDAGLGAGGHGGPVEVAGSVGERAARLSAAPACLRLAGRAAAVAAAGVVLALPVLVLLAPLS